MNTRHLAYGVALAAIVAAAPLSFAQSQQNSRQQPGSSSAVKSSMPSDVSARSQSGGLAVDAKVSVGEFRQRLEPMGQYVRIEGLGEAWKPRDLAGDWRPYGNGRWIFNDKVGWYFASDEQWAEITYHYGRWYKDPQEGWVWIAGEEWAPAWVEWRKSKGFVGWRPLAPANAPRHVTTTKTTRTSVSSEVEEVWVFVPQDKIVSERIETVRVAPTRTVEIYRESRDLGRVERRGTLTVNFALRPEVLQRETSIKITSQNLPQAQMAPVPQQVRAISTEQRTTSSTVSGQQAPAGQAGSNAAVQSNQAPAAAGAADKSKDAAQQPAGKSPTGNAPADSKASASGSAGAQPSANKADAMKSSDKPPEKSSAAPAAAKGDKAGMDDKAGKAASTAEKAPDSAAKAIDKSAPDMKANSPAVDKSKADAAPSKGDMGKSGAAAKAPDKSEPKGKKTDSVTTGATPNASEPADKVKPGSDSRSEGAARPGGASVEPKSADKKADAMGAADKPLSGASAAKDAAKSPALKPDKADKKPGQE